MKKFIKNNRKFIVLGSIGLIAVFVLMLFWFFIVPAFNSNKYGDRLKDEKKYKISNEVVEKIKNKSKDNDSVLKITYHKEGRILNFVVTVDSNYGVDQSKEFANSIIDELDSDSKEFYDVQIFIKSDQKSDSYPIVGYKSKNSDKLSYGNAGGNGE